MKLTIASLLVAAAALVAAGPDPRSVYIESIAYGGTGCPKGTVSQTISGDRTVFTLIFDNYIAELGPGVGITQNRKNCQLTINLKYPQGWQYAVLNTQFRGYSQLDRGVHGQHKSTFYFAGNAQQVSLTKDFYGPAARDYLSDEKIGTVVWAPCRSTAALNVNSQVRMFNEGGNPSAQGMMTNDSQDGKFKHIFGFSWRNC